MEWELDLQPIGTVRSCFLCKNGTPRQPTIASSARGQLKIRKGIYNNPEHALEGLREFSYVWLIFLFHKNKSGRFSKAKVSPPRLNGGKLGVFATRSPYRLNPIGLSLVKLESVEGDTLHFSGHDLVDGTPVLDIKPYIREYDCPPDGPGGAASPAERPPSAGAAAPAAGDRSAPLAGVAPPDERALEDDTSGLSKTMDGLLSPSGDGVADADAVTEVGPEDSRCEPHGVPQSMKSMAQSRSPNPAQTHPPDITAGQSVASQSPAGSQASAEDCPAASEPADSRGSDTWLSRLQPERWTVSFTAWAESQLRRFSASESAGAHRLRCLRSAAELRAALVALLTADPRSVYRRTQSDQLLYHLALDASHVTCWFDASRRVVEVLRLQPLSDSPLASVAAAAASRDDH
ncbi:tRNA (adenine(37)-N6)-methyltransferase-like [Amphibalanus amphitrite]|uniref:tRNA (adenine(37)-N6)-methyltransferase-like n=1 Tax=Amphibalanus amphitrite TaxID=1232801 RepID=UPI001C90D998|nr:tRNA (adenine(37)-N6)-methyltransferase-like [Amphibalanus amphitrite]